MTRPAERMISENPAIAEFDRIAKELHDKKVAAENSARNLWIRFRAGKATREEVIRAEQRATAAWAAESDHWDPHRMDKWRITE